MIEYKDGYEIIGKKEFLNMLQGLDESFRSYFTETVDFKCYAEKIVQNAYLIIGYKDSQIVGFCAYYDNDKIEKAAFLTLIYIYPNYRKMGIARTLIAKMVSRLKQKGLISLSLEVFSGNESAIRFYKKLDFVVKSKVEKKICMVKKI